jgi:hypothetical protein
MAAIGAAVPGPYGQPWRKGRQPYRDSALVTAAAFLKRFYLFQATLGLNRELAKATS